MGSNVGGQVFKTYAKGFSVIAGALTVTACGGVRGTESGPTPPPIIVTTATLQRQTVPIGADFVASTAAKQSVDVHARVQGTLDHVYFKEGTLVHEGQLLFALQRDRYVSAVQAAQASLMKADGDLRKASDTQPVVQAQAAVDAKRADLQRANQSVSRLTPLARSKAVPQKDLDNALSSQAAARAALDGAQAQLVNAKVEQSVGIEQSNAAVLSAKSQLSDAQLNLSYTTIRAPVSGLIGFLTVDPGNVVGGASDQVLTTISTVDPMKVTFSVDEVTYINLVNDKHDPGERALRDQALHLVLADNSVYPYAGRLYAVNRTLDAKTGTILVEAMFPNPRALLRPGQFARVRLTTALRYNAVLIPQSAVVQTQGATSAYVIGADTIAQLRTVTLGPQYRNDYVVEDGLRAGERVVVAGTQRIRPGAKVVVARADPNGR
jgi:membrane fusion protein (multidrug efflux system)